MPVSTYSESVLQVARDVERDIERRRLVPGDRYYTSEEARRMFRVGKGVMNQALSLLAEREVLARWRKAGTFVGPKGGSSRALKSQTIYMLLPADREGLVEVSFDLAVEVFRHEVPKANVQFSFFPSQHATAFVSDLVESARAAGRPWGALAIGCPYEVMDFLVECGAPVVALTSFVDEHWSIPSVDTDRQQAGSLLTEHLLCAGHKQIALMNFSGGSQGCHDFYDGVSEALSKAALPHNALIYRELPADLTLVTRQVHELMRRNSPPTAFIARSLRIAQVISQAVCELSPAEARRVDIVFQDHDTAKVAASPWVHTVPQLAYKQVLVRAARLLNQTMSGAKPADLRIMLPVELRAVAPRAK